ncbi:MAG: septum formation initiator, partial [Solirubrobacterales bacterium]
MPAADQRRSTRRIGDSGDGESGSVSLELVGARPVVAISLLASLPLAVAGYVIWSAGTAARAGARAV